MIQPATPADAAALAALHAQAFPPAEAWSADAITLMLEMPGAYGFWRPGGGLVLARQAADEAEILTIGVVPAARRQGRGAALLLAALAQALTQDAVAMYLEVAADNAAGLAFYLAHDFAQVGRRRNYYGSGRDALVLRWTAATG